MHPDRGPSMASKPVALLLADPGVTKTHSRSHVTNDNPFSESQFKTMRYRPDFPNTFDAIGQGGFLPTLLLLLQPWTQPPSNNTTPQTKCGRNA